MIRKSDFSKCLDSTARREGGIFGRSSPAKSRAVRFRRWCLPTFSPAERLFLRRRLSRFEAEEAGVVAPMYVLPVSGNGAEELLRARARIIASSVRPPRGDGIVPFAVEIGGLDVESGHLGVGDLDAFRIVTFVEATSDGEPCVCGGAGDQLDDDQVADQRLATPVLGDVREQPMLYLVPLTGAGRNMTDGDLDPKFVGQQLQFALP